MTSSPDIVALGFCSVDYLCVVPEIPRDAKVEIVESLVQGGGPAATAAVTAARLGVSTAFVGGVGDDERGRIILAEFRRERVHCENLAVREGADSAAAFCWAEQDSGKRSIVWTRGTAAPLRPEELDEDLIRRARLLLLDGHQTEAAVYAAKIAREAGTTVLLDAGSLRPHMVELIPLTDITIASETFARDLTGNNDVRAALRTLAAMGPATVAVTLGPEASVGFDGSRVVEQPSFPVDVVDTTGAGDVYHGAFAVSRFEGNDLARNMRFATAVAAMKCRRLGGRTGIPARQEVMDFLAAR